MPCIQAVRVLLTAALAVAGLGRAGAAEPRIVVPSGLLSRLQDLAARPEVTPSALADAANRILATTGLDYEFDVRQDSKGAASERDAGRLTTFVFLRPDGTPLSLSLPAGDEGACQEHFFTVPCAQVTDKEMVVVLGRERLRVKRPASFGLDTWHLVDERMTKVLRSWQIPWQSVPLGTSKDCATVYLGIPLVPQLRLEVSDAGVRFAPAGDEPAAMYLEDYPHDSKDAYLRFVLFRHGKQSCIIRFSGPCT